MGNNELNKRVYIREIKEIKVLKQNSDEVGISFQLFVRVVEDIGEVLPFSVDHLENLPN